MIDCENVAAELVASTIAGGSTGNSATATLAATSDWARRPTFCGMLALGEGCPAHEWQCPLAQGAPAGLAICEGRMGMKAFRWLWSGCPSKLAAIFFAKSSTTP